MVLNLDEIAELLRLEDGTHCSEARMLAERKLEDVRRKLADLRQIETVLAGMVARCGRRRNAVRCPLIATLQASTLQ